MSISRLYGPLLFSAGAGVLAWAIARGEASLSLVVIVPVMVTTSALGALGIVLVVAAFLMTFLAWPFRAVETARAAAPPPALGPPTVPEAAPAAPPSKRWGGVLFLGPIPIVFGSDARVTWAMLLLGVVLFLALLGLTLLLFFRGP